MSSQDGGQLPTQCTTLSVPRSAQLPSCRHEYYIHATPFLHSDWAATIIIVAGCTSHCIRFDLTLSHAEGSTTSDYKFSCFVRCFNIYHFEFKNNRFFLIYCFMKGSCGMPHTLSHGRMSYSNITVNSRVTYICNTGYEMVAGNSTRTCKSNGQWSGTHPICVSKSTHTQAMLSL